MKRNLLFCGIVAGPLFIGASLAQAFTRTGFDLARHPISLLGLGSLGWIQIANFVVCGVLYVLGAVGLRAALRPGRSQRWGPLFIGITGVHGTLTGARPFRLLRRSRTCARLPRSPAASSCSRRSGPPVIVHRSG